MGPSLGDYYLFRIISGVDSVEGTAVFRLLPALAAACRPPHFEFRDKVMREPFWGRGREPWFSMFLLFLFHGNDDFRGNDPQPAAGSAH